MWWLRFSANTALVRKKLLKKLAVEVLSPIHQRFEHKYVSGIYTNNTSARDIMTSQTSLSFSHFWIISVI